MEWNDKLVTELLDFKKEFYSKGFPSDKLVKAFEEYKTPKLDYEILSFISKNGTITYPFNEGSEYFLSDIRCGIHSVNRLIDNEIFTIGDKTNVGNISCIGLEDKIIFVHTDCSISFRYPISVLNKEPKQVKQVLFRTDDNVPIYEGDTYYPVYPDFTLGYGDFLYATFGAPIPTGKYFKSKEDAEYYILMNKPLFSVQEIMDILCTQLKNPTAAFNTLKYIAKTQLNDTSHE